MCHNQAIFTSAYRSLVYVGEGDKKGIRPDFLPYINKRLFGARVSSITYTVRQELPTD